jgi:Skp family chaperone for outer membrane proteins
MVRKMIFPILILMICMACGGAKSTVVVVVDVDKVAQSSARAKRAIGEVEAFVKSVEDKMNEAGSQMQTAARDPRRTPQELQSMQAQWGQLQQQAQSQVDARKQAAEQEIRDAIDEALKTLGREQGWDVVVRKGTQAALWSRDGLDVTDLVVKRMDAQAPTPAPKT